MSFDWSTFILEIVNFLVLVWLLQHFLYKPVMNMVERRQQAVQKTVQDAQAARDEAAKLEADYQARNAQWQTELAQRRRQLDDELETERQRQLQAIKADLAEARAQQEALQKREQVAYEKNAQARAAQQAARFASRLLGQLATPALEQRILDTLLTDIAALPEERMQALQAALRTASEILVRSSHPLAMEDRASLEKVFATMATPLPSMHYVQDADLVSGLRISVGAWELDASIAGELHAFAECGGHA